MKLVRQLAIITVIVLAGASTAPPAVTAAGPWVSSDLGTLGGRASAAVAVNSAGQVAGSSLTAGGSTHAFIWNPVGGMTDLGTLGGSTSAAIGINDAGQVIGTSTTKAGQSHGFVWSAATGMVDLGTLGGPTTVPAAINNAGQVVGSSTTAALLSRAFIWTAAKGIVDLGTLGGGTASAADINDSGVVCGASANPQGKRHAFLWTSAGGMVDLGTLAGGSESFASTVNAVGWIAGTSFLNDTSTLHAFLWKPATGMADLGFLNRSDGLETTVSGLTDAGQVVGVIKHAFAPGANAAFSWKALSGMTRVPALGGTENRIDAVNASGLVVGSTLLTGNVLTHAFAGTSVGTVSDLGALGGTSSSALAVNDLGVIVGSAATAAGLSHAAMWKPSTPPLPQTVLTVTRTGTGSGTVSSFPAGIGCGADCVESFNLNTVVTLTASASPGSFFAGWTGACTGTAVCLVTMNTQRSVTATFTLTLASIDERIGVGLGPIPQNGGWMAVRGGAADGFGHARWALLPWSDYNASGGAVHVAAGDVDGDGLAELVVGLGAGSGGWLAVFDDAAHNHALLDWIQVGWPGYNTGNGEVWPAVGDLDGDGRAEIVAGLGDGSAGWFEILDDATTGYAHVAWRQVDLAGYTAGGGGTHPAIGNVDGIGASEIVLGLGSRSDGWIEVVSGSSGNYAHRSWARVSWPAYGALNGTTFPAAGDLDGDGRAEIVVGLGSGGGGWLEVLGDATTNFAHAAWLRTSWWTYNTTTSGETHPAVGNVDAEPRAEIAIGLDRMPGVGGWFELLDDEAAGYASLGWRNVDWPAFTAAGGATFPAIGRFR